MEWKIENNCHGVKSAEFKFANCELNVVSQKLIRHSFLPHLFIPCSLNLVHISDITLFALKWQNYSVRIIFLKTLVLLSLMLTLERLTSQHFTVIKMNSSGEKVLLGFCCFLLDYNQEQIKRKRKRTWVRKIFK